MWGGSYKRKGNHCAMMTLSLSFPARRTTTRLSMREPLLTVAWRSGTTVLFIYRPREETRVFAAARKPLHISSAPKGGDELYLQLELARPHRAASLNKGVDSMSSFSGMYTRRGSFVPKAEMILDVVRLE